MRLSIVVDSRGKQESGESGSGEREEKKGSRQEALAKARDRQGHSQGSCCCLFILSVCCPQCGVFIPGVLLECGPWPLLQLGADPGLQFLCV